MRCKMLGTKINKPLETQEQLDEYTKTAEWCNDNNATIEDKGEYYEVVEIAPPTQEELNAMEVERLKAELSATDYKCLKWMEGALTDEEYSETKKYRAELRKKINDLL